MNNIIYLKHNTIPILFNNLQIGDGKIWESFLFDVGSIWHDEKGIIRQFSLRHVNNSIGNYFLMPIVSNEEKYINQIGNDLAEFGIKVASGSLFVGSTLIVDLARFLFEKYSKSVILSDFEKKTLPMGYVTLDNRQIIFRGMLNMNEGISIKTISFDVRNQNSHYINFQTSRNASSWMSGVFNPGEIQSIYFANGQTGGYLRLITDARIGKTYRVKAQHIYIVVWNNEYQMWDLEETYT